MNWQIPGRSGRFAAVLCQVGMMCGRYASARKRIELLEEFSVQRDEVAEPLKPDYNVAPTKPVYAVVDRAERPADTDGKPDAGRTGGTGAIARELRVMRWGLVPFWAKDVKIGSRMINARAETVAEKPAFRRAFARRRCLLPADGYYEWQQLPGEPKQPIYISRSDGQSARLRRPVRAVARPGSSSPATTMPGCGQRRSSRPARRMSSA